MVVSGLSLRKARWRVEAFSLRASCTGCRSVVSSVRVVPGKVCMSTARTDGQAGGRVPRR